MKKKTLDYDSLYKTHQQAYEDYGKGYWKTIFKDDLKAEIWKIKDGKHILNIVPFVCGDKMPTKRKNPRHENELAYVLDLYVHSGIGPNNDAYVCLNANWNAPCFLCEEKAKLVRQAASDALIDSLKPRYRTIYNVIVYDSREEMQKGIQIWEVAWWYFEKHLMTLAERPAAMMGVKKDASELSVIPFSHPKKGKMISFQVNKSSFKDKATDETRQSWDFLAHQFHDREEELPEDIALKAHQLDQIIHIPTNEEMEESYAGHMAGAGKQKAVKEEKYTPPVQTSVKERAVEAEAEVAEEPEEAPEEKPELPKSTNGDKCPKGHKIGEDIDEYEECRDCPPEMYGKCLQMSEA